MWAHRPDAGSSRCVRKARNGGKGDRNSRSRCSVPLLRPAALAHCSHELHNETHTCVQPSGSFAHSQVLAHFTPVSASVERERLLYFASAEGRDDMYKYVCVPAPLTVSEPLNALLCRCYFVSVEVRVTSLKSCALCLPHLPCLPRRRACMSRKASRGLYGPNVVPY